MTAVRRSRTRGIWTANTTLPDGRTVQCFVNRDTGLVVVDVIDADEKGGREVLRLTV